MMSGGLAACGSDEVATTPTPPADPPIDVAKSVSGAPPAAKVRLVVDAMGNPLPDDRALSVRTRADFTISSAISKTPAESDAAIYRGIDLLQQDDAKLITGLVPVGSKTKFVQQSESAAKIVSKAVFFASIKGGTVPVLMSWSSSATRAKSTKALLRRTPIEVRTVPLKAAAK